MASTAGTPRRRNRDDGKNDGDDVGERDERSDDREHEAAGKHGLPAAWPVWIERHGDEDGEDREQHHRDRRTQPAAGDGAGQHRQAGVRHRAPGAQHPRRDDAAEREVGQQTGERHGTEQQDVDGERCLAEEQGRDRGHDGEVRRCDRVTADADRMPGLQVRRP